MPSDSDAPSDPGSRRWSSTGRRGRRVPRASSRRSSTRRCPRDWDELAKDGPGSDAQAAFSRGFCARLAERGWLTPHWPAGVRRPRTRPPGGTRSSARSSGRAASRAAPVHERQLDRPGDHEVRQRGAEARAPAAHRPGRRLLVSGLLGAGRRLGPRGAAHPRAARGRRLRRQRLEDLDLLREPRRLLLPARAQRPGLEAAPRHRGAAGADGRFPASRCARSPRWSASATSTRCCCATCACR